MNRFLVHLVVHDEFRHVLPPYFLMPVVLGAGVTHLKIPSVFFSMGDARSRHGGDRSVSVGKRHGFGMLLHFHRFRFNFLSIRCRNTHGMYLSTHRTSLPIE